MNRDDIVQVNWPFTDHTGSKSRPAVVVQADYLATIIDDTILVQITSKIHGITGTEVILDPLQEPISGLNKRCVAACSNILTYDENFIQRKIGVLSDATMQLIDECLKTAMGL
jgi:mRNA interferase MazF